MDSTWHPFCPRRRHYRLTEISRWAGRDPMATQSAAEQSRLCGPTRIGSCQPAVAMDPETGAWDPGSDQATAYDAEDL